MSDKRKLIFNAVLSLIKENGFDSKIKVSDIANKANIGKGTVYEYFNSKEEIIVESIKYFLENNMEAVLNYDNDNKSFESSLKNYLKSLLEALSKNASFHSLFISQNIGSMLSLDMKIRIKETVEKIKNKHDDIFKSIIKKGIEEKILSSEISDFNIKGAKMIIIPMIMDNIFNNNYKEVDNFIDDLYKLIIKILY